MKTIHVILNAHLDPVWLWPWQSGLGEAIATCRSACDRLDKNPDAYFTRGESWIYEQIEKIDPQLFGRIREHIRNGRWEIAGGWYIQPDCNLPSYWAMQKQIAIGKQYFLDRFGIFPRFGYNVDSFGHSAALPGLMRSFGQDSYVLTRPDPWDIGTSSRLFRWRGYEDGPDVTVCRPSFANAAPGVNVEYLKTATEDIPDACEHGIVFCGVGDHGGGPTEAMIAWLRRHAEDIPGWRVEFSTLSRYFSAIEPLVPSLPVVTGDLHPHAIGCYSVYRSVKTSLRRAEHLLAQAEAVGAADGDERADLEKAWKRVCFHHFHDTLAGSSTQTAYAAVLDQLGGASAVADEALQYAVRRKANVLPPDAFQRLVILNANTEAYDGYIEAEVYMGPWTHRWLPECSLIDENGEPVEFQMIDSEAIGGSKTETIIARMAFRLRVEAGETRVLRIKRPAPPARIAPRVKVIGSETLSSAAGMKIRDGRIEWTPLNSAQSIVQPVLLHSIRDMSDTWSHDLYEYGEDAADTAVWRDPVVVERGPLMASMSSEGCIGDSTLRAEWRLYADEPYAELLLRVHWRERFRVLKMVMPFESATGTRVDGIMGSSIVRPNDGREWPLRDWTLLDGPDGRKLGIVCPDVYGIDATAERVRLTLLRSPAIAHHEPASINLATAEFADQGVHRFRFRFFLASDVGASTLERHAMMLQRPLVMADTTRGMPATVIDSENWFAD